MPSRPVTDVRARLMRGTLVCDGAMGTMLHAGGVSLDRALPELNESHADLVRSIHRAYLTAGADIIETNTFGASRLRLGRFGLASQTTALNRAGVRAARGARVDAGRPAALVAGSVSPATPAGQRLAARELRDAFREQLEALYDEGSDLVLFETFGSLAELVEAIGVARTLGDLPVVAQMTFVEDGRTLGGDSPEEVATTLGGLGVAALGANCTLGPQGLLDVLVELARWSTLPLTAQPNAGPPTLVDGHFQYSAADPAYFARHARRFVELGATLVGGCCGTTPAHIEAIRAELAAMPVALLPVDRPASAARPPSVTVASRDAPETSRASEALLFGRQTTTGLTLACELPLPVATDAALAVDDAVRLRDAGADAVIVGPVGSTRAHVSPASLALLVQQRVPELEVILTATTWEKSLMVLQADLLGTYAFGIRHVLCRTGTPPLHGDYPNAAGVWEVDSQGLIEVLRGLNEGLDYNGIPVGRPTRFVIGARVNPAASDFAHEVQTARRKLAGGAHFLTTPPVFDLDALERLLDAVQPPPEIPVLLGLMPLQDLRHAEYLQHEVPEMRVPLPLLTRMAQAGERGPLVGQEITRELLARARERLPVHGVVLSSATGSAGELAALLPSL
jgi:homocysteine S-methyltransferase